ncbi:type VI secretion system baseplate subunit TssF [Pseudomonas aeruginosa]
MLAPRWASHGPAGRRRTPAQRAQRAEPAAPDGQSRWRLVSQLTLNHLSLVEAARAP